MGSRHRSERDEPPVKPAAAVRAGSGRAWAPGRAGERGLARVAVGRVPALRSWAFETSSTTRFTSNLPTISARHRLLSRAAIWTPNYIRRFMRVGMNPIELPMAPVGPPIAPEPESSVTCRAHVVSASTGWTAARAPRRSRAPSPRCRAWQAAEVSFGNGTMAVAGEASDAAIAGAVARAGYRAHPAVRRASTDDDAVLATRRTGAVDDAVRRPAGARRDRVARLGAARRRRAAVPALDGRRRLADRPRRGCWHSAAGAWT